MDILDHQSKGIQQIGAGKEGDCKHIDQEF